jgi:[ribosomal protein S5]-alanine N-acetyltransferase
MRADDIHDLLGIFGDPKVMAAFGAAPFDLPRMQLWLDRNLAHEEKYDYGLFSVIHKGDRRLIGNCGLEWIDLEDVSEAELGFDFHSDYWNQGFATEAAGAIRDFAFDRLKLPRLVSLIRHGNKPSRRVAEKIGMHHQSDVKRSELLYWVMGIRRS